MAVLGKDGLWQHRLSSPRLENEKCPRVSPAATQLERVSHAATQLEEQLTYVIVCCEQYAYNGESEKKGETPSPS